MRKILQLSRWAAVLLAAIGAVACAPRSTPKTTAAGTQVDLSALWVDPADLASRDFFDGPGGRAAAPVEGARFEITAEDHSGYSRGFDVRDRQGVQWSVKVGKEAQPEVEIGRAHV